MNCNHWVLFSKSSCISQRRCFLHRSCLWDPYVLFQYLCSGLLPKSPPLLSLPNLPNAVSIRVFLNQGLNPVPPTISTSPGICIIFHYAFKLLFPVRKTFHKVMSTNPHDWPPGTQCHCSWFLCTLLAFAARTTFAQDVPFTWITYYI